MANRTVKDFEFPASFGFTGSGGKTPVKGYMRGGSVAPKKGPEARVKSPPPAIGWTDYKKGGKVKKADGGLVQRGAPTPGSKFSPEAQAAAMNAQLQQKGQGSQVAAPISDSQRAAMNAVQQNANAYQQAQSRSAPVITRGTPEARARVNQAVAPLMARRGRGQLLRAKGGKVHDDKAEDLKMIRAEIKKSGKASR